MFKSISVRFMYFSIALPKTLVILISSLFSNQPVNFVAFQLVREGSSSLLEVLKVDVVASLDIPVDVSIPLYFS